MAQAMQAVAGRSGFIAKINSIVLSRDPLSRLGLCSHRKHLTSPRKSTSPPRSSSAIAMALRNFATIDAYKNFGIIHHGSFSCDEDRLGQPE